MDLIKGILEQKGGDLISALTSQAGFGQQQAEAFLPEAGESVMTAMAATADDLDMSDLSSAANVGAVLQNVDVASLAARTGLTTEQGSHGLSAMLPMLLGFIGEKGDAGSLLGMLKQAGDLGDVLGGLKGLGKLFG